MKYFTWDDAKNEKLKADRGIGFEEIVFLIGQGRVLDILEHPNPQRYGGQRILSSSLTTMSTSCRSSKTTS